MFARQLCFGRWCVLLSTVVFIAGSLGAARAEDTTHRERIVENVNWEAFLAQHDLTGHDCPWAGAKGRSSAMECWE